VAFDVKAELWRQMEGDRNLTLRVARAFPAARLLDYAPAAPLRPFAAMLDEIARIELANCITQACRHPWLRRGLAENTWRWNLQEPAPATDAAAAIATIEDTRAYTRRVWPAIDGEVLVGSRDDPFFGQGPARPCDWLVQALENEIHHRGQALVYLRELGVEPPRSGSAFDGAAGHGVCW